MNDEAKEIGEMTWSDAGPDIMIIDHTFVEPEYRGQKLAEKLVLNGVELARREGKKLFHCVHMRRKNLKENLNINMCFVNNRLVFVRSSMNEMTKVDLSAK